MLWIYIPSQPMEQKHWYSPLQDSAAWLTWLTWLQSLIYTITKQQVFQNPYYWHNKSSMVELHSRHTAVLREIPQSRDMFTVSHTGFSETPHLFPRRLRFSQPFSPKITWISLSDYRIATQGCSVSQSSPCALTKGFYDWDIPASMNKQPLKKNNQECLIKFSGSKLILSWKSGKNSYYSNKRHLQ